MLTPRIWVFYDENADGWNWDVATETASYRSARYNPYDSYEEVIAAALKKFLEMDPAGESVWEIVVFNSVREYVHAQIERDTQKRREMGN